LHRTLTTTALNKHLAGERCEPVAMSRTAVAGGS
jgi:hypothetical protein